MTAQTPVLTLRGLTKDHGDFRLGPLDLDLEPGQVLAFVGPNGAGKTTTLHAVMNLLRPDDGTVEVCGRRNDPNDVRWKEDVGFVGERQGFYQDWSGSQNLDFLGRFYSRWDGDHAQALAYRFDLPLGKKVKSLSQGNRAKLALVAALAHRPRLLLLDEPTGGLDPVVRSEVLDTLWELLEGGEAAILYSTHVLSDVSRLADELAFLRQGRLVQRTAKDALTEAWRRVSFELTGRDDSLRQLAAARGLDSQGASHRVISSDYAATSRHLGDLGATRVESTRMTIDEIAVEILKEGHRVAAA